MGYGLTVMGVSRLSQYLLLPPYRVSAFELDEKERGRLGWGLLLHNLLPIHNKHSFNSISNVDDATIEVISIAIR